MPERNSVADIIGIINSEIVISHNAPKEFLVCCMNKNGKTESIWMREPVTGKNKKLAFNYKLSGRKNNRYYCFLVKKSIVNELEIPDEAEVKTLVSDKKNTYINFYQWNDVVEEFIRKTAIYCVEHFDPSDKFGCCSKYKECSDAKKCLHKDLFYSKACWYRKNLEAGKIFY